MDLPRELFRTKKDVIKIPLNTENLKERQEETEAAKANNNTEKLFRVCTAELSSNLYKGRWTQTRL